MDYVYQIREFVIEHKFWMAVLTPAVIAVVVLRILR